MSETFRKRYRPKPPHAISRAPGSTPHIAVRLSENEEQWVADRAETQGRSMSATIRACVQAAMSSEESND